MHPSEPRCRLKYCSLRWFFFQNTLTSRCSRCLKFNSRVRVSPELVRKMHNTVEDWGFV